MTTTPTILSLDEAIGEIAQACQYAADEENRKRFVFLVGAGLSYPSVPLARNIESDCREIAEKRKIKPLAGEPSAMERYSYWFGKAYPQRLQRQRYLKCLIEKKAISLANFRLAHLLLADCVANIVITPNFDNFLSRALATFGHDTFRICDHPGTVERISQANADIQIVQVHGTYWSYDQANLSGELEERSKPSSATTSSMAQLLDSLFKELSPIVVGYSGWEGDVIMRALHRRLHTSLAYKSYWFCYRRSDFDLLPGWLKDHQDVVFVLPPEAPLTERPAPVQVIKTFGSEKTSESAEMESPIQLKSETIMESCGRLDVVEAHTVFDRLLKELKAEIPPLVRDPLNFFAKRLEDSVPPDNQISPGAAAYSFGSVIERIRNAQKCLETGKGTVGNAREAEKLLEEVRDAIRRSLYEDALKAALRIAPNDLEEIEARDLLESLSVATRNVDANSDQKLPGLDLVIQFAVALSKKSPGLQLDLVLADALFNKGITLGALNRSEEEIGVYDDLVRRFGDSPAAALQEQVARALFNKGATLGTLNRSEGAIGVYDDLVRRFGDCPAAALQEAVARALVNKGITLGALNRSEEAIGVYDDLVRRFGDSPATALQEAVARALVNKGITLGALNRSEEAIGVYDDLVRRFGDSPATALQEAVARALLNRGVRLGTLNRNEEAIGVYDDLVRLFGDSPAAALQQQVAKALVNKGITLGTLNRSQEEIGVYDDLVRRFGDSPAAALQQHVARALLYKGFTLGTLNRNEGAIGVYDDLVRRFGDSPAAVLQEVVARALVNKGVRLGTLNRDEEAIGVYDDLVRRFGDSPAAALQEQVARALINKGITLGTLNRSQEEIGVYDDLVRRFGDSPAAALQQHVAR